MRSALVAAVLCSSVGWADPLIVAQVLKGQGRTKAGAPCRLSLEVASIEEADDAGPTPRVGDKLEVVTACYTFELHQQGRRGDFFRFKLKATKTGELEAWTVGGPVMRPPRTPGRRIGEPAQFTIVASSIDSGRSSFTASNVFRPISRPSLERTITRYSPGPASVVYA